ncbi:MAG TPA: quinone-dependent dihydroorotate dehydrogenase [Cyclobacteriaceae bacterium]|nr:quinone-dependent dihydroorotate dehydrogenase [Cyclobacteriaceae bacterium]
MYKLIRPILFSFDAEKIHHLVFKVLQIKGKVPGFKGLLKILFDKSDERLIRKFAGLTFRNPVGLAAGFDKNALLIDELSCFGFGFIEIGTLTPKAQPGNAKPRLFRLPADHALINRMGFNNDGVEIAVARLKKRKSNVIVGGNIGKNKSTPNEKALDDYALCFEQLYPYVDYFVVNVSSPNTPGLRELQEKEPLRNLLAHIKGISNSKPAAKPILLKIAPDLTQSQLDDVITILKETRIDGVIATNTTVSREGLKTGKEVLEQMGAGGLSGKPLTSRALQIVSYLRKGLGKDFLIIGSGGIMTPQDAIDRLNAGADLVQVYTGFIYEGPGFVKRIVDQLIANSQ